MIHLIFACRDAATEHFLPPMNARAEGEATRAFEQAVKNPETMMYKNPEHFDLYYLGTWDDNSGKYETLDSPRHVAKAIQFSQPKSH